MQVRKEQIIANAQNDCWSMGFMADQLFTELKLRLLTIVDNFTKVNLIILVSSNYKAADVGDCCMMKEKMCFF